MTPADLRRLYDEARYASIMEDAFNKESRPEASRHDAGLAAVFEAGARAQRDMEPPDEFREWLKRECRRGR